MKNLVSTLAFVVLLAGLAGVIVYRIASTDDVAQALAKKDPMEWLRADFDLNDAQFTAIKQLHDSYSVVCEEHCRAIQDAARARNELKTSAKADATAIAAAERRVEELRRVCESAIATHVRACAEHMSPGAGRRYLALVLPKIKDFDHEAPPDLQLNLHRH
jgi:hypothetical protein